MPTLMPLRDYDDHDVINLFAYSGDVSNGVVANAGTLVAIQGDGWRNSVSTSGSQALDPLADLGGSVGASFNNTVSERYNVGAKLIPATATVYPNGMLLYDVREEDENGEKLIYNPRKAAEMGVTISGQASPIVTKGTFLYSGATLATAAPKAGAPIYATAAGEMTTGTNGTTLHRVGMALGSKDQNDHVLIHLDIAAGTREVAAFPKAGN